jgi:TRAP-type C4-dicarboxylate transport system permease large subunit
VKLKMPDVPLASIFKGIAPFFATDILRRSLVVFFPAIVLWLRSLLS